MKKLSYPERGFREQTCLPATSRHLGSTPLVSVFTAYHSDQSIIALLLPSKAQNICRLTVEGHGPPSLCTLPGPGLVAAKAPAGRGRGSEHTVCVPGRRKLGALIWAHLLACHHLLAKMVKSHTLGPPAEENLISPPYRPPKTGCWSHLTKEDRQTQKENCLNPALGDA